MTDVSYVDNSVEIGDFFSQYVKSNENLMICPQFCSAGIS